jgi:hypothetical protein
MDFGSFFEWYKYESKCFRQVKEKDAVSLENAFRAYRDDNDHNVIFFEKESSLKKVV